MKLERLFAFSVAAPLDGDEQPPPPMGNTIAFEEDAILTYQLQRQASRLLGKDTLPAANLRVEGPERHSEVRDALFSIAFGQSNSPISASRRLANRLQGVVDGRSPNYLFIPAVFWEGSKTHVILWLFGQTGGYDFQATDEEARLRFVASVFTGGGSRKAAAFQAEGVEESEAANNDFLIGLIWDQQDRAGRSAAQYWVDKFLDADWSMSSAGASRLLAKRIKAALAMTESLDAKENIVIAALALRKGQPRVISFERFGKEHLEGDAQDKFFKAIHLDNECKSAEFRIDKAAFTSELGSMIYQTQDGVTLIEPLSSSNVQKLIVGDQRHVRYEGVISKESFGPRGGSRG